MTRPSSIPTTAMVVRQVRGALKEDASVAVELHVLEAYVSDGFKTEFQKVPAAWIVAKAGGRLAFCKRYTGANRTERIEKAVRSLLSETTITEDGRPGVPMGRFAHEGICGGAR